ncbi:MAG: winged helix-turn-helix transcriptional regulator, partial [Thaumarchaeota archaeon]|nr:winged helix-turn-helix transcriptional regulator [Nitrososphaerota archaeon]
MASFDDLDMKILAVLIDDSSISVPKLSDQIKVNSSVVYSRIKRLVKKGLIERFTLEVDEGLLGFPVRAIIGCNV